MQPWEYMINELGEQGWELAAVLRSYIFFVFDTFIYYFKRPKQPK
jgi:hypothetical protein